MPFVLAVGVGFFAGVVARLEDEEGARKLRIVEKKLESQSGIRGVVSGI